MSSKFEMLDPAVKPLFDKYNTVIDNRDLTVRFILNID